MVSPAVRTVLLGNSLPPWVLRGKPSFQIDWANGRALLNRKAYSDSASILALFSTFSTPAHYALGTDGKLYLVPANSLDCFTVPGGLCQGQLIERSKTNIVLWNRDLTNAVWVKSNVTVAKDQTGADGIANSASSLTATSTDGTVLQTTTLGSSPCGQSAYVKRLVGSGTVSMTMDNGSTWTAITLTSGWTRVNIPAQTLANPTVGFKLATSGDAIAVDFVQNELVFATTLPGLSSPIATTTTAVTRAASNIRRTLGSEFTPNSYSMFSSQSYADFAAVSGLNQLCVTLLGNTSNYSNLAAGNAVGIAGYPGARVTSGGSAVDAVYTSPNSIPVGDTSLYKWAGAYALNDLAMSFAGKAPRTQSTVALPAVTPATMMVGMDQNGNINVSAYFNTHALFPSRIANASLQALTA